LKLQQPPNEALTGLPLCGVRDMHPSKLHWGGASRTLRQAQDRPLGAHLHCTERSAAQVLRARFWEIVLNFSSFPFRELVLPSRRNPAESMRPFRPDRLSARTGGRPRAVGRYELVLKYAQENYTNSLS